MISFIDDFFGRNKSIQNREPAEDVENPRNPNTLFQCLVELCHVDWEVPFKNNAIFEKYLNDGLTTCYAEGTT